MEWEAIVNQNSNAKKRNEKHTRKKNFLNKAIISTVVACAFVVANFLKLVHPILGEVGMLASLCVAFYNIGRAKESA